MKAIFGSLNRTKMGRGTGIANALNTRSTATGNIGASAGLRIQRDTPNNLGEKHSGTMTNIATLIAAPLAISQQRGYQFRPGMFVDPPAQHVIPALRNRIGGGRGYPRIQK